MKAGSQLICHLIFICKRPVFHWSVRYVTTQLENSTSATFNAVKQTRTFSCVKTVNIFNLAWGRADSEDSC